MTDTTLAPTNAEILDLWADVVAKRRSSDDTPVVVLVRDAIAKWGAPAPASFPARITALLHEVKRGPWEDASGEPLQDDADAALAWIAAPPAQEAQLNPDMPVQELRLHMGELTADEVLVARAAIRWANLQKEARVPLSDEGVGKRAKVGPTHTEPGGKVSMFSAQYRQQLEQLYVRGFRDAEKHHGITAAQKETP